MRAELATFRQTLTPAAGAVLTAAISEASRRSHSQTTPLHVATTLLASPSSMLRQACLRSHPTTSHPLQCRALELCFSVALDRLPKTSSAAEPPLSNALVAALKRAQAHQRRGCPEIQQQLLLTVRVELEQLVVSILDDPSVSRVMREASFSSPAAKAAIESKSLYLNPKLEAPQVNTRAEDVKRVIEILSRAKKRNPVLVGDSWPASVLKEVLERIELGEVAGVKARIVALGSEVKVGEVEEMIERERGSGVVVDMGDLKWVMESGGAVVEEMTKVLKRFTGVVGGGDGERVWVVGTATCETYLRCQVYHPCMERDWNLQPVSIASGSPPPPLFQRNRMVCSTGLRSGEQGVDASRNHEKCEALNSLPPWLQLAAAQVNGQEANWKDKRLIASPPVSPKTDLVLGRTTKDIDTFKKLLQGITEMLSWQPEAAPSSVINGVMQKKPRGDKWLLFSGRDRVAKTKMATALSELTFGSGPVYVRFGNDIELDKNIRGQQLVDRIVDTIKHNQFAVTVVEDIDKADALVQGMIKHAIEHGRLIDSYGREISLGNIIVILTTDLPPEDLKYSHESIIHCEQKILHPADSSSHVEISSGKRKADPMSSSERPEKQRKDSCLSFDLNLAADVDEDSSEASQNSSDVTVENELISIKSLSRCQDQFLR
ncbi:putative ATPase, AAA-type, core, Clp, repeat (R) domain, Clp domain superfamily [Dioscorea sansibarensis]